MFNYCKRHDNGINAETYRLQLDYAINIIFKGYMLYFIIFVHFKDSLSKQKLTLS